LYFRFCLHCMSNTFALVRLRYYVPVIFRGFPINYAITI